MQRTKFIAILLVTLISSTCPGGAMEASLERYGYETEKGVKPQSSCPLMGGDISAHDMYVDVKGKRIYICCAACEDAVRTEPDKYIRNIEERGEKVADTPLSESKTEVREPY